MLSPDDELARLLEVLIDRYGPARSLGETYAATCALRLCREGHSMSMSEFSQRTGLAEQNLSRWAQNAVKRERLKVRDHPDDGRIKEFAIANIERAGRHLPAVAEVFGVPMDTPKKRGPGQ